jgi:hypothetical protein
MTTPYKIGYYYERKTMDYLRTYNYGCLSSRGSHGCADICAWKKTGMPCQDEPIFLFIQVKSGKARVNFTDAIKLKKFREELPNQAQLEVWFWRKYAKVPERFVIKNER